MSENLIKLYVEEFSTNLMIALQQRQSKLRGRVMEGHHVGQQASPVEYIDYIQMKTPTGRYADLSIQNVDFSRRWVMPVSKEAVQLIDRFDKLQLLQDPTSRYTEVASAAVAREWDDRIIAAAFGTAYTGTGVSSALTSETWASIVSSNSTRITDTFDSTAASGLTAAKMKEAKRKFRKAQVDVDAEPLTWVTNSQGESDLLNEVQVVSTDFAGDRPILMEGKVTRFLGFDIVYSERLTSASNVRSNIAMVKSGMYLGIWQDVQNDISQRKDLSSLPYQIYTSMVSGATRLEPGRVLEVQVKDTSTAADVTP